MSLTSVRRETERPIGLAPSVFDVSEKGDERPTGLAPGVFDVSEKGDCHAYRPSSLCL